MATIRILIATAVFPFLISACSSDHSLSEHEKKMQAIDSVNAAFGAGAITFQIASDTLLNAWNDISNSCSLLIIQSSQKKTLKDLMNNPVLIKQYFSSVGKSDDILQVDKYIVMPGQGVTLHIDRSEGTKYVSIIAGYYPFPEKQHMLLFDIPIKVDEDGWWDKKWHVSLMPLVRKIYLGKESIKEIKL
ncbi:type VI secretion lipoprotein TssJ [Escherichia coli]|uniref:type VI secretion lipoprotein TssJ n=1 Tax=Escherichia coli TaxID=562 RepID=UPI000DE0CF87|nr:type VI secretion lipoprotein TssJ [Escherichia coli]EER0880416.1 type VI secretion lipoprotein TssJ [Escherichia coli]EJV3517746.1 type VI secretion lipoprotein TssJ [Escherichia coli]MDA6825541.1 type VI secretion lipoprotein TssJ [Escherichia coli]MDO2886143.1 type VI secretion lipoprotein TssJ [Escherichia coli]MVW26315.1 type VI secretion protein [Escherichia coli]